jgi:hypothetical protein
MKINSGELSTFYPKNNLVLVKPTMEADRIGKSGLLVDTSWKPEHHARVVGTVVSVPKHLIYGRKLGAVSMEWKTDMDLKIGDEVWMRTQSCLTAAKDPIINEDTGEEYYLIPYWAIYLCRRKNKIIMLNGNILVEPITEQIKSSLILPKAFREKDKLGIVRYIGQPNYEYKQPTYYDDDYLRVGDVVVLTFKFNNRLENKLHLDFDGKEYIVTQRRFVWGIIRSKNPVSKN